MSKGTDYEIKVMNRVQLMLDQEELGISPKQAKISHKPAYYSRDRQKNIIFDVSIEVYRKGADKPHWIGFGSVKIIHIKYLLTMLKNFMQSWTRSEVPKQKEPSLVHRSLMKVRMNLHVQKGWHYGDGYPMEQLYFA